MKKKIILFTLLLAVAAMQQSFGQQTSLAAQIDSIEARLPQLQGDEKLEAIGVITDLTSDMPVQKQYVVMYLEEARRQKNMDAEGDALTTLVAIYTQQYDNDSVFIVAEEAIRFTRQHRFYNRMFINFQNLIKSYNVRGQALTALRLTEEAYAEAKELQQNSYMAKMLYSMGEIYTTMMQNSEAMRCFSECLELLLQERHDTWLYIETYANLASLAGYLDLNSEMLQYADSMQVEIDRARENHPTYNMQVYDFFCKGLSCSRIREIRPEGAGGIARQDRAENASAAGRQPAVEIS